MIRFKKWEANSQKLLLITDSNVDRDEKLKQLFSLITGGHMETQFIMKEGFVGLAIQKEFPTQKFLDRLLANREEANNLLEDFQKQTDIELNTNTFEFSKIILDFELLLEVYQNEVEELKAGELSGNDLSFTQNSILDGVKHALEKINKYFTD